MQAQENALRPFCAPSDVPALVPAFARDARALDDASFLLETLDNYDICLLEIECIELNA